MDLEPQVNWTDKEILTYPSHMGVHLGDFDPKLTNDQLQKYGSVGRVKYGDGATARELSLWLGDRSAF